MKILVATSGHRPDDDRIYYKEIATLLTAGHEVTLVTRNQQPFDPGKAGFSHVDFVPGRPGSFGRALGDLAASWRPDIVMIHEFDLLPVGSRIRKKWGIPLVYDVHEPNRELWDLVSTKPPPLRQIINWGLWRFEQANLRSVDHVLATSDTIAARYRQQGLEVTLIPNFPQLQPLHDPPPSGREPTVIYEGQVSLVRGMALLIRAFAGVSRAVPSAKLEIIGPEDRPGTFEQLHRILERQGLFSTVTIREKIPHPEVLARLKEVQIGVIPFIDHPLFHVAVPIKLFEYMLSGCAVLASDTVIIRQYSHDAALLVPPADVDALRDGLIQLLTDANLRRKLAARGRALIEKDYNWQRVEPVLLKTLESLL